MFRLQCMHAHCCHMPTQSKPCPDKAEAAARVHCRQMAHGLPCPAEREDDPPQGLLAVLVHCVSSLQHCSSGSAEAAGVLILEAVYPLCQGQHMLAADGLVVPLSLLGAGHDLPGRQGLHGHRHCLGLQWLHGHSVHCAVLAAAIARGRCRHAAPPSHTQHQHLACCQAARIWRSMPSWLPSELDEIAQHCRCRIADPWLQHACLAPRSYRTPEPTTHVSAGGLQPLADSSSLAVMDAWASVATCHLALPAHAEAFDQAFQDTVDDEPGPPASRYSRHRALHACAAMLGPVLMATLHRSIKTVSTPG